MHIDNKDLSVRYHRLRRLAAYKGKPDAYVLEQAKLSLARNPPKTKQQKAQAAAAVAPTVTPPLAGSIGEKFSDRSERALADSLLRRYIDDYNLEHVSEQNAIQEVIFLEVVQRRLQDKLNKAHDNDVNALPHDTLELLHKNGDAITKLKLSLGLAKTKDKLSSYDAFQHFQRRMRLWGQQNQASLTHKCPSCQGYIMFWLRNEVWDSRRHPYFRDNMIYNKHLFAHLGQTVTIDTDFIAAVLETSRDYIDWVLARVSPNTVASPVAVEGTTNEPSTETVPQQQEHDPSQSD